MIERWYVVWLLLAPNGARASDLHFISGPWPSVEECTQAGIAAPYPPDSVVPGPGWAVSIGCVQIDLDPQTPPADDAPKPPSVAT